MLSDRWKKILQLTALLLIGFSVGAALAGYIIGKQCRRMIAEHQLLNMSWSIRFAEEHRLGKENFVRVIEKNIPADVRMISENPELRDSSSADLVLDAAKSYYVCTKTPIPKEIAGILKDARSPVCDP